MLYTARSAVIYTAISGGCGTIIACYKGPKGPSMLAINRHDKGPKGPIISVDRRDVRAL